jgi:alpha-1,2-mannosyltransferase
VNTAGARTLDANRLRGPALAIAAIGIAFGAIRIFGRFDYGYDFAVYRVAGDAVVHHESLFGPWIGQHLTHPLPFTYPPLAAVFAVPFALIGDHLGYALWNVASVVALVFVVRASTKPLVRRFTSAGLALAVLCAIAIALTPVQDEIGFGQVGIVLMAMCFFDCLPHKTRLPRGVLVGAATAIKLVPGIFIPYLWLSGRRRAAVVATATFVTFTLAGAALTPTDSKTFWTSRVFDNSRVGSIGYVSNQSLNGMLVRAFGSHVNVVWFVLATVVVAFGLRRAAIASRRGQELNGIALAALVGLLASPVSWIHHLVWIVPVLAVLVGNATDRRRVALAATIALLFALRLPYLGDNIPPGWHVGWVAAVLRDSYGLLCVLLLFTLARLASAPRAPSPLPDAQSAA